MPNSRNPVSQLVRAREIQDTVAIEVVFECSPTDVKSRQPHRCTAGMNDESKRLTGVRPGRLYGLECNPGSIFWLLGAGRVLFASSGGGIPCGSRDHPWNGASAAFTLFLGYPTFLFA
jgi:hypothetical protein